MGIGDSGVSVYGFVVFCVLLVIGVSMLSNVLQGSASKSELNSYELNFSTNPSDGQTLTLDNIIYEFDSGNGVSSGHVLVPIATTLEATVDNLRNAIKNNSDYTVE
jgi:hypothetical protein